MDSRIWSMDWDTSWDGFLGRENEPVAKTDKTANLLMSQYADWQSTFEPIELQALQQVSYNNPSVLASALDDSKKTVQDAYGSMGGVLERQNRSLGLTPTTQQTATSKRLMDLNQAASTAGAENQARANVRQMNDLILMGTTPNPNIAKEPTTTKQLSQ
jgi:hypothetical protein